MSIAAPQDRDRDNDLSSRDGLDGWLENQRTIRVLELAGQSVEAHRYRVMGPIERLEAWSSNQRTGLDSDVREHDHPVGDTALDDAADLEPRV